MALPVMKADIVLIDGQSIATMPLNNVYGTIVFEADSSAVSTVIVGSVVRKQLGRPTQIDLDRPVWQVAAR